jgi:hypothetical protein
MACALRKCGDRSGKPSRNATLKQLPRTAAPRIPRTAAPRIGMTRPRASPHYQRAAGKSGSGNWTMRSARCVMQWMGWAGQSDYLPTCKRAASCYARFGLNAEIRILPVWHSRCGRCWCRRSDRVQDVLGRASDFDRWTRYEQTMKTESSSLSPPPPLPPQHPYGPSGGIREGEGGGGGRACRADSGSLRCRLCAGAPLPEAKTLLPGIDCPLAGASLGPKGRCGPRRACFGRHVPSPRDRPDRDRGRRPPGPPRNQRAGRGDCAVRR